MKNTREFAKQDVVVVFLCVVFVVLAGGAIGRSGREHARMVICGSRLRQLGLATHDYATDTGYLPIWGEWRWETCGSWADHYAYNDPIVGPGTSCITEWVTEWDDPDAFGTPGVCLIKNGSLEDANVFDQACPTSSSVIRLSYGYNYGMLGSASSVYGEMQGNGTEWVRLTKVQIPAETGMYCDSTAAFERAGNHRTQKRYAG